MKTVYTQKCINRIIHNVSLNKLITDLYLTPIKTKTGYYLKSSPFVLSDKGYKNKRPFYFSDKKKIFKCFYSGYGGNVIIFVMRFLKVNRSEAITFLLRKYNQDSSWEEIVVKKTNGSYGGNLPF